MWPRDGIGHQRSCCRSNGILPLVSSCVLKPGRTTWVADYTVLFDLTLTVDVWSIGCILAELLAGKPLFKGKESVLFLISLKLLTMLIVLPFCTLATSTSSILFCKPWERPRRRPWIAWEAREPVNISEACQRAKRSPSQSCSPRPNLLVCCVVMRHCPGTGSNTLTS